MLREDSDIACVENVDVSSLKRGVDSIKRFIDQINLNRVVLAGHRGMALRKALKNQCEAVSSGLCMLIYANIGEQCANVHSGDSRIATDKAKRLVAASIRKAKAVVPRKFGRKEVQPGILVIGGGISGLSTSLSLAEQGMRVTLIEKSDKLGGSALSSFFTVRGSDIQSHVRDMVSRAETHSDIEILKNAQLKTLQGTWGSFRSIVSIDGEEKEILHGAVVFATGGKEGRPQEYLLGKNEAVITQKSFELMLQTEEAKALRAKSVVIIQCVGSRDDKRPYCSRICCVQAVKNALKLKELNPDVDVCILYRDIRTYGFYEKYYHEARDRGIIFVRYEPQAKPEVRSEKDVLKVCFFDSIAGEHINLDADLLVLSTGIVPNEDNSRLAKIADLELNADGFFVEANPKAAPLDSVDRGKYFCGICHSPNFIENAICQGKAAAARSSALLWKGFEDYPDNQAYVVERLCAGCGLCVSACPYDARIIDEVSLNALVLQDLCKGCGTCVVSCPNGASQQYDYERSTILEVLDEVIV
jgi:heterodisulfide reductase subunit A